MTDVHDERPEDLPAEVSHASPSRTMIVVGVDGSPGSMAAWRGRCKKHDYEGSPSMR
jgi:hypothetical protein